MSSVERGPIQTYEVVWKSGHVDRVLAHQVSHHNQSGFLSGLIDAAPTKPETVTFHGEFDGRWMLVLLAPMDDIHTIRNISVCQDDPRRSCDG